MAIIANLKSMMNASKVMTEYMVIGEQSEGYIHVQKRYPGWTEDPAGFDVNVDQVINVRVDCGAGQTAFDTLEAAQAAHAELDSLANACEEHQNRRWYESVDPEYTEVQS